MTYFFLVPLFALWLLAAAGALLMLRFTPSLRHLYPLAFSVALWSSLGFIVGNAALMLLIVFGGQFFQVRGDGALKDVMGVVWGGLILAGPVLASAIGWLAGLGAGLLLSYRKSRRRILAK
jgi:hypothetical protein